MKEMMKRCLSLGFSLTVIIVASIRRGGLVQRTNAKPQVVPGPGLATMPIPMPVAPPTSIFSGTVVRDGSRFALRDPDGSLYALDSTGRAWPFEGEEVTIRGYLADSKLLHVGAIEAVDDVRAEAV